jgi:hypothetical protein
MIHGVQAAMPFPLGLHHTALVPPLKLARRDSREGDYLLRCEAVLHNFLTFRFNSV